MRYFNIGTMGVAWKDLDKPTCVRFVLMWVCLLYSKLISEGIATAVTEPDLFYLLIRVFNRRLDGTQDRSREPGQDIEAVLYI